VWAVVALSIGLAMDATAVAAARGLAGTAPRDVVLLPLLFGGFQAAMSAFGWLLGDLGGEYAASWNTWLAFGLLVLIGLKMIVEGLRAHDEPTASKGVLVYLGLAIATSIDAAAAGVALPLLDAPIWLALLSIGGITAAFTVAGYLAGTVLGNRFGSRLEVLGGVVLLVIAAKVALY
jgi:manganese efflux pump family protein